MTAPATLPAFVDALVEAGADAPFSHDGLIFWLVPKWVVEAYAAARLARQPVTARMLLSAHMGRECVAAEGGHEDWVLWRIGRGWLARCGALERKARGMGGGEPSAHGVREAAA